MDVPTRRLEATLGKPQVLLRLQQKALGSIGSERPTVYGVSERWLPSVVAVSSVCTSCLADLGFRWGAPRTSLLKLLAFQPVEGRVHTSRGELSRAARSAAHAILFEGIHVPSDITNMCMFRLGFPGENRTQEENNCRRSKRPKGADFFGCVEVSNIVIC